MNDAIFKFKRYEDSSLTYTGFDKHEGKDIGGWDTVLKRKEYEQLFYNQQATMEVSRINQPEDIEALEEPKKKTVTIKTTDFQRSKYISVSSQNRIKSMDSIAAEKRSPFGSKKNVQEQVNKELDLSSVKEGAVVMHKAFGMGKVTMLDKARKHIRVRFSVGEKTFLYPDAFNNGFLKTGE